jgi:hypothetical protein
MTTDAPLAYKPEVASALIRAKDKLLSQIRGELKLTASGSVQGSLYVMLVAIVGRYTTTLARHRDLRDVFFLIKGGEIESVPKFVVALSGTIQPQELAGTAADPSFIATVKMVDVVDKIRRRVSPTDTANLEFYDRLRDEINSGKIASFGELCDRLPTFIVELDDDMRQARHGYHIARDAKATAIHEFKVKYGEEIKLDLTATTFGTLPNILLRVLRTMINDFAEPAYFDAWVTLRDSVRSQRYTSAAVFLAGVPEPLRSKANQSIINILPQ